MKVALVHEFLNQYGGAERVLENLVQIFPNSTLHVLIYNQEKMGSVLKDVPKKVSYLNKFPFARNHHKLLLPLMPNAIESFNFDEFDIVISDCSSFAKGVRTGNKLHVSYCHTPTRFLWTEPEEYLKVQPYPEILKAIVRPMLKWIRRWDYKAAQRPHFLLANSANVKERIKKYYHRDSEVLYPPIDTEFFKATKPKEDYFLVAGRLEPYKKTEKVIEAFNQLGLRLKVVGSGSDVPHLKQIAGPNIEFVGKVTDEELRDFYSAAKAFIFPALEDAGMMMLEAQSCCTPVIAYRAGGALELIQEHVTGEYFDQQTAENIKEKIQHFDTGSYDSKAMREFAQQFDKEIFKRKISDFVEQKYAEFQKGRK